MITDEMINDIYDLEGMLPMECVEDCTTNGDDILACLKWVEIMKLKLSREKCAQFTDIFGAWGALEREKMTTKEFNAAVLWIAAWNVVENAAIEQ